MAADVTKGFLQVAETVASAAWHGLCLQLSAY